ncbi:MAG: hypothetical protein KDA81_18650, partial [Planctomycetaceae bacterium]|nr:hypothetical protein [Planctomycetaceae bacterium]
VGPSGSGKTSLGRRIFGADAVWSPEWNPRQTIVEQIAPDGGLNDATGALSAVGLGSVPAWVRPHHVLSQGEQFRANLARLVAERPPEVVVDEFTSVVDRQIAKIGAAAFAKAWRRGNDGQRAVMLSCHHDTIDWLQPDWVLNTGTGEFHWRCLRRVPEITFEVVPARRNVWPAFEPHHYLKCNPMPFSRAFLAMVDGEPVAHVAFSTVRNGTGVESRACRLVVLPEWQGAGIALRFLEYLCEACLRGDENGPSAGTPRTTLFHTSHPQLAAALRRRPAWDQVSCRLYGENKARSARSMKSTQARIPGAAGTILNVGYGGHFRAVQGFRYVGA